MNQLTGIAVTIVSAILVYFLHTALEGEVIPIILFLLSAFLVVVDFSRRYFYIVGLSLYPLITVIDVAITRDQSLCRVIIFDEVSMVAMVLFGAFSGTKLKKWMDNRSTKN